MFRQYQLRDFRLRLVVFVYAITILGILIIGSARAENQSQQLFGMVLGTIAMLAFALIDYHYMLNFYWLIYGFNMLLLIAVQLAGTKVNGAKRWLDLGVFRFQPSDLTKLLLILFFAKLFTKYRESINSWKVIFLSGVLLAIPLYFVYEQPDLSTSITIMFVFCVLIYIGGLSYKIIGAVLAILIPSAIIFINLIMQEGQQILDEYQFKRIMAWLNPAEYADDAYQQQNSIIAIGSGQLYGKGLYNNDISSVKNGNFIVEPQTDFIFAVTGEELGFIGCAAIIILLALIVMECLWIGKNAREQEGTIICCGIGGLIAFQSLVNICVATGLMPNTGITLPFVSYGLTSLVMLYMGIGIVLNIGLQPRKY
ncbi:MAG: rod shape-determining protein RodA [Lachnospiraceae bacterium]|nr:rod shape-determining protein RodA [Lachnospiraceae bacterium]